MSKKIIGIVVCDNSNVISVNNRIPIRLQPYLDYVKRLIKGCVVITSINSYSEVIRVFSPREVVILSRSKEKDENIPENIKFFNDINKAISYCSQKNTGKTPIPIIAGPTLVKALCENNIYDEFTKICIDVDFLIGEKLDVDFSYYQIMKKPEEFYSSGYSFWYEIYNMKEKLLKPQKAHVELTKLENFEDEI